MKNRIKQIRKNNKLTQVEFGEKIGVKGNTITNYENGLRSPTDAIVLSICREFDINEEWLRTGKGEMQKEIDVDFGTVCADIGIHDQKAKEAIMKYYELTEEDKNLWWKWIERFTK